MSARGVADDSNVIEIHRVGGATDSQQGVVSRGPLPVAARLGTRHRDRVPDRVTLSQRIESVWRSFFLAVGAMLVIVGIETMVIDSATIYSKGTVQAPEGAEQTATSPRRATRVVQPEEWVPWTAMSIGAIVVLYAFTLPQRFARGGG